MENQILDRAPVATEEAQPVETPQILRELVESELLAIGGGTGNVIF
ncbi:MAG: hypothetical protein SF172_11680 [Burkholderiales bacterium]|nr:hypothetical protein [Burkholderiales bacterium]